MGRWESAVGHMGRVDISGKLGAFFRLVYSALLRRLPWRQAATRLLTLSVLVLRCEKGNISELQLET